MMTKLSRIDSSSNSLKYSTRILLLEIIAANDTYPAKTMKKHDDLNGIRVPLGKRHDFCQQLAYRQVQLTVEVAMSDMKVVDSLVGEARGYCKSLLFHVECQRQELLHTRRGNIIPVASLDK